MRSCRIGSRSWRESEPGRVGCVRGWNAEEGINSVEGEVGWSRAGERAGGDQKKGIRVDRGDGDEVWKGMSRVESK
jgi:hypothetical protein